VSVAGGDRRRNRRSVSWFSLAENASFDLFRSLLVVSGDFEWAALYTHLLGALAREVEEFCIKFALDCLLSEEIPLQCIRIDLHEFLLLLVDYMAADYAIEIFDSQAH
jgi:hypothetical protein